MEKDWTKVKSFDKEYLAEMAKEILEDNGIVSVTINKHDRAYVTFGCFEVYVADKDLQTASDLLKELN